MSGEAIARGCCGVAHRIASGGWRSGVQATAPAQLFRFRPRVLSVYRMRHKVVGYIVHSECSGLPQVLGNSKYKVARGAWQTA